MASHIVTLPKSSVPYIGIPIPGAKPFVVQRERFEGTIHGINITDWRIETGEQGRYLVLTHVTGRRRGRSILYDQSNHHFKLAIWEWATHERKRLNTPKIAPQQRKIGQLKKKLSQINPRPPVNPLIPDENDRKTTPYTREHELLWYKQTAQRKALARIAGRFLKFKITLPTAYKEVKALGYTLKFTYGKLPHRHQSWSQADYWRNIYDVVGLSENIHRWWDRKPKQYDLKQMQSLRMEYIAAKQEAYMLQEQLEAVKAKHAEQRRAENEQHHCTPQTCPKGNYYVSARNDSGKTFLASGPYTTHAAALDDVQKVLQIADSRDGRAWFMAWGTVRMKDDYTTPGILQRKNLFKIEPPKVFG